MSTQPDVDIYFTAAQKAIKTFLKTFLGPGCLHCNEPKLHSPGHQNCLCYLTKHRTNCFFKLAQTVFHRKNFLKLKAKKRYDKEILEKAEELGNMAASVAKNFAKMDKLHLNPRNWTDQKTFDIIKKSINSMSYYF
tara:strand:+ start:62 stop:469 length:408 start_codon:yes stop_codon:yes gene_type:complete